MCRSRVWDEVAWFNCMHSYTQRLERAPWLWLWLPFVAVVDDSIRTDL